MSLTSTSLLPLLRGDSGGALQGGNNETPPADASSTLFPDLRGARLPIRCPNPPNRGAKTTNKEVAPIFRVERGAE